MSEKKIVEIDGKRYRLDKEWPDKKGNRLQLLSIKGKYDDLGRRYGKEDRLFFIRINDSEVFPITHEQQIFIMTTIIENDIFPPQKLKSINEFKKPLEELEAKTIAELNQEREKNRPKEIKQEKKEIKQEKFLDDI